MPGPYSCLNRAEGCAAPRLAGAWPAGWPPAPPPAAAVALPPLLPGAAALYLGAVPSAGEVLSVSCAVAPPGLLSVAVGPSLSALLPACGAPAGGLCVRVPASYGASFLPLLLAPSPAAEAAAAGTGAPPPLLSCEVRSSLAPPAAPLVYPRFGNLTRLSLPVALVGLAPPLLLSAVLVERWGAPGQFFAVGGSSGAGGGEVVVTVTAPPPPGAQWANLSLPMDAASAGALLSRLAPLRSMAGAPASLSVAVSAPAHLLLLAAPGTSLSSPPVAVALGGAPCVVNWVTPGGELASVTTPPAAAACGGAQLGDARPFGNCGVAPLVVGPDAAALQGPLSAVAAGAVAAWAVRAPAPAAPRVPLPFAWPPLLPRGAWGAPDAAAAAAAMAPLLGVPPLAALPLLPAAAAGGAGAGLRVVLPCSDASLAPLEACDFFPGAALPPPATTAGAPCPWGGGAACVRCPPGARCPGGNALLAGPGYWVASPSAPPDALTACADPDAAARCPGGAPPLGGGNGSSGAWGAGSSPCGPGYRGVACGACAAGFFPQSGACAACPALGAALMQLLPPLRFAGGLLGAGALLFLFARSALRQGGHAAPASASLRAVGELLLWAWVATQVLCSQFGQLEDSGAVPPQLAPLYAAVAALQFKGVTLAPACYDAPPFQQLYGALGAFCGAAGLALALSVFLGGEGSSGGGGRRGARLARGALRACALALSVGYGAFVNTAVGALSCLPAAPMPLADYAVSAGDGRAAREALGALAPPWAALAAAGADPAAARALNLTALLRTTIPVSVLASDPFQPCQEGPHAGAWNAAAAFAALLAALPAAGLAALCKAGRIPWCHRRGGGPLRAAAATRGADGGAAAGALADAFNDDALRPPARWWKFYEFFAIGVAASAAALTARAAGDRLGFQFVFTQCMLINVMLTSAGLAACAVRPHTRAQRWRTPVQALLYVVTAVSAAVSLGLGVAPPPRGGSAVAWALGVAPILLAFAVYALLLAKWWAALAEGARVAAEAEAAAAALERKAPPAGPEEEIKAPQAGPEEEEREGGEERMRQRGSAGRAVAWRERGAAPLGAAGEGGVGVPGSSPQRRLSRRFSLTEFANGLSAAGHTPPAAAAGQTSPAAAAAQAAAPGPAPAEAATTPAQPLRFVWKRNPLLAPRSVGAPALPLPPSPPQGVASPAAPAAAPRAAPRAAPGAHPAAPPASRLRWPFSPHLPPPVWRNGGAR